MTEIEIVSLIKELGFPIFVAAVLLYDKLKTNGSLRTVVENSNIVTRNNNDILHKLEKRLCVE